MTARVPRISAIYLTYVDLKENTWPLE